MAQSHIKNHFGKRGINLFEMFKENSQRHRRDLHWLARHQRLHQFGRWTVARRKRQAQTWAVLRGSGASNTLSHPKCQDVLELRTLANIMAKIRLQKVKRMTLNKKWIKVFKILFRTSQIHNIAPMIKMQNVYTYKFILNVKILDTQSRLKSMHSNQY